MTRHIVGLGGESWQGRGELTHAKFFPWPRPDLGEHVLGQDVLVVSGGNTANMLAIWRLHGFEEILREACITDSFGPQLEAMRDGLGFLPGSACPHHDGEERRRPTYRRLVDEGFPPGIAVDDGVALHYEDTELAEVVSVREAAQG